jgi:hypothetical protein
MQLKADYPSPASGCITSLLHTSPWLDAYLIKHTDKFIFTFPYLRYSESSSWHKQMNFCNIIYLTVYLYSFFREFLTTISCYVLLLALLYVTDQENKMC